jgi:hypothetical protein
MAIQLKLMLKTPKTAIFKPRTISNQTVMKTNKNKPKMTANSQPQTNPHPKPQTTPNQTKHKPNQKKTHQTKLLHNHNQNPNPQFHNKSNLFH